MDLKFRGLYPDEIEIRVGNVSQRGATLLLYKNARVDMALLDQVVGPMNWQRDHKEVKGNMYCGIGITDGHDWVWKWDCGTESNTEAEKGESSDSFKRAGKKKQYWDIPRSLRTLKGLVEYSKHRTEIGGNTDWNQWMTRELENFCEMLQVLIDEDKVYHENLTISRL